MTARTELIEITGINPRPKENPETFRQRRIEGVDQLDDDAYRGLSKGTKGWVKKAMTQFNNSGKVPDFDEEEEPEPAEEAAPPEDADPDGEDDEEEDETGSASESEEDEMSVTEVNEERGSTSRKAKSASAAKRSKKAAVDDEEEAAPKKRAKNSSGAKAGGLHHARKLLAATPDMAPGDLAKAVAKAGFKVSSHTLSTTASGFRAAVKTLQEAGLLKKK